MAEKLMMIALSPTMEQGTIVSWIKKEGDEIASGDVVCEVETDKATMEYEAAQEGILLKIILPEGGQAEVGQTIGIIGESGEDTSDLEKEIAGEAAKDAAEEKPAAPAEEKAPAQESPAPKAAPPAPKPAPTAPPVDDGLKVLASPLARVLAEQSGLDIRRISGTGPSGRVVKRDIEAARANPEAFRPVHSAVQGGLPTIGTAGEDRLIPLSNMRKAIAKGLSASKFSAPHFYLKVDVRGEGLVAARSALIKRRRGDKVSVNAFLIKYAAEALKRFPDVNASWQEDAILQHGSIDIGLAVAVPNGLITPIVRNCGNKGVEAIDAEMAELIAKAQIGKLRPEEYSNATFTISSLGSFGIDEFTAIINPPGSAILAVGALKKVPVVDESGSLDVGQVMKLSLSCDHRVIDGAVGAGFLTTLKTFIEDPVQMIY